MMGKQIYFSRIEKLFQAYWLIIFMIIPVAFYEGMKWGFHAPRYLFLQFSVFLLLAIHFFKKRTVVQISRLDLAALFLILFISVHSIFNGAGGDLFNRIDILLYMGIFYLLLQFTRFEYFFKQVIFIFSSGAIFLACYGLLQYFGIDPFRKALYPAAESMVIASMGNANSLAGYLAAIFPYLIYALISSQRRFIKVFWGFSLIITLSAVVLTLSRGAWLALIGTGLIFYSFKLRHVRILQNRIVAFYFLLGLFAFLTIFGWATYQINPESAIGRIFIWKITQNMIAADPIWGIGYGRYGVEYLNYQAKFFEDPVNERYFDLADNLKGAKNEYLQILVETGIGGFILFFILFFMFYHQSYKVVISIRHQNSNSEERLAIMTIVVSTTIILLHALVDNVFYAVPIMVLFWFNLAMVSVLAKKHDLHCSKFYISFSHHPIIQLAGLILLFFNIFVIWNKAKGYIYWQDGQNYVAAGLWEHGIKAYEKALRKFPRDGELQFHLGAAYAYTRKPEKALKLLKQATQRFNDKNLYIVLGYTYIQLKDFYQAEKSFNRALQMYPKLLLPRLWLAELYLNQGKKEAAIQKLNSIIKTKPKNYSEEIIRIKQEARQKLLQMVAQ